MNRNIYEIYEHASFINGWFSVINGNKSYQQFIFETARNKLVKQILFR